jgi:hypothetical protein
MIDRSVHFGLPGFIRLGTRDDNSEGEYDGAKRQPLAGSYIGSTLAHEAATALGVGTAPCSTHANSARMALTYCASLV